MKFYICYEDKGAIVSVRGKTMVELEQKWEELYV